MGFSGLMQVRVKRVKIGGRCNELEDPLLEFNQVSNRQKNRLGTLGPDRFIHTK